MKIENEIKTAVRDDKRVEIPELYLKSLEEKIQFLSEESERLSKLSEVKVEQFSGQHNEPPEVEVNAPNPPTHRSGSEQQVPQESTQRRTTRWDVPPPTAPVVEEVNQNQRCQPSPQPTPPIREQVIYYHVNGQLLNAEQYHEFREQQEANQEPEDDGRQQNIDVDLTNVSPIANTSHSTQQNVSQSSPIADTTARIASNASDAVTHRELLDVIRLMASNQNNSAANRIRPAIEKQKAPNFNGDKTIAYNWLREFNRIADANAWDNELKMRAVPSHLEGKAQNWYYAMNRNDLQWPEFEKEFRRAYLPEGMEYTFFNEMQTAKQRHDESGLDFLYRVLELRSRVNMEVTTHQIVLILMKGFHHRSYQQIAAQHLSSTIEEVIEAIKLMDSVEDIRKKNAFAQQNNPGPSQQPAPASEAQPKPPDVGNQNRARSQPKQGFLQYCANCGKPGHRHMECSIPRDQDRINKFFADLNAKRYGKSNLQTNVITGANTVESDNQNTSDSTPVNVTANSVQTVVDNKMNVLESETKTRTKTAKVQTAMGRTGEPSKRVEPESRYKVKTEVVDKSSPVDDESKSSDKTKDKILRESRAVSVNGYTSSPDWPIQRESFPIKLYEGIMPIPNARICVEGYVVQAAFDTGSNKSAINHNFKALLDNPTFQWKYGSCRNFDGSEHLPSELIQKVKVQFNNKEITIDLMVVKDLKPDVVLGMDFLTMADVDILPYIFHITTRDDPNYQYFQNYNYQMSKTAGVNAKAVKPMYLNWLTPLTGDVIRGAGYPLENCSSSVIDRKRKRLQISLNHYRSQNQMKKEKWQKKLKSSDRPEEPLSSESEDSSAVESSA